MSHYDNEYDEYNRHNDELKARVDKLRRDLKKSSQNEMIKILFAAYIDSLTDSQVIKLYETHHNVDINL